jgi:nitrogenase molybdenum-iron protein alpha/beta subunit
MESVREATYRGHHIVIRTSYRIEVDEQPIVGHMGVSNDGQVHYHPIPNLGFDSAVDLVKKLIDTFPDDFDPDVDPDVDPDAYGAAPEHEHGHGDGDRRGS